MLWLFSKYLILYSLIQAYLIVTRSTPFLLFLPQITSLNTKQHGRDYVISHSLIGHWRGFGATLDPQKFHKKPLLIFAAGFFFFLFWRSLSLSLSGQALMAPRITNDRVEIENSSYVGHCLRHNVTGTKPLHNNNIFHLSNADTWISFTWNFLSNKIISGKEIM